MANSNGRHITDRRKHHPLVKLLRKIRKHHKKAQVDIEACMQAIDPQVASMQMLKRIESGARELPGLLGGSGPPLSQWIQAWLICVEATSTEREEVESLLVDVLLGRLSYGLLAGDDEGEVET
jgi:hypothetical protein